MSKIHNLEDFQQTSTKLIENFRLQALRHDFSHLNLQLLEQIKIDYFGQQTALKYSVKVHRQQDGSVLLTPFVPKQLTEIYDTLVAQAPGWTVVLQKESIRLNPPLATTENKEKVIKILMQQAENTKVQIRQLRQTLIKQYQKDITAESELQQKKSELEKVVLEMNKKIENILQEQAKRIRTV